MSEHIRLFFVCKLLSQIKMEKKNNFILLLEFGLVIVSTNPHIHL